MASQKWNRSSVPTVGLVDACLEIANRNANVLQVIINSVLHPLKICGHLQMMLPKLSTKRAENGSKEAEEDAGTTAGMIGGG